MNFSHRFNITFTVQSPTGSGTAGSPDPTFGAQRTIKGRKDTMNRRVFTADGEAYIQGDVFVTDQPLAEGDRYWDVGTDTSNNMLSKKFSSVHKGATFGNYTLFYGVL
jgi:hypothetical protein